jgi:tartronate-semialdehyde synthase
MAKMSAIMAAVHVLEKEGITCAFGVPGAAINPLYSAMRKRNSITHLLARHVEGASHMADGYTRAQAGNIGVCIGTSGPAGTDMITGLYAAWADSVPILCITGQAPRARLYKEDFQAVDIESGNGARAGAGAARFPAGVSPYALRAARSGPDRPALRRADGGNRIRSRHL